MCFAVRRGTIRERSDVNYALKSIEVDEMLAHPRFPLRPLGDFVSLLQYGTSSRANTNEIGLPVLRMNNLRDQGWDLSDLKHIDLSSAEAQRYRLDGGDILFNRTNSKELVGKCAVFREEGHWLFASYLLRVKLDTEKLLPEYVSYFLNGRVGRVQIDRLSRQIIGMANINAQEIRSLLVPVPPLNVQQDLVDRMQLAYEDRIRKLDQANRSLLGLDAYLLDKLDLATPQEDSRRVFATRMEQVHASKRLDADYFHPERALALREQQGNDKLRTERLAAIAEFVRDGIVTVDQDNYVGLAHVQSHTGELVSVGQNDATGTTFRFTKDDILFARLRPYLNKVHRAEESGVCSTEFHVIRIRPTQNKEEHILPVYLAAVLRSSLVLIQTKHMMTGNTHPRLTNDDVTNLVVPVPALSVQQTIADEIAHRRADARRLRDEAEIGWKAAQVWFEEELFDGDFTT